MEGWISIHRKIQENDLWLCESFTRGQAWIDLLLLANHEEGFFYKRGVKIDLKRGQVGWSELALSVRWKWSRNKVRKFLNDLEKEQQIKQQKTNVTQILTLINYEKYQKKDTKQNTKRTTEGHQKDTNNNDNNDNNDNNNIPIFEDFKKHAIEKEPFIDLAALKNKYDSWVLNGWKDGNNKKISNWKSKLTNTLTYIPKGNINHGSGNGNNVNSNPNGVVIPAPKKFEGYKT